MRCLGINRQLKRCRRESTSWWPFCAVHKLQVAYLAISLCGAIFASYLAIYLPDLRAKQFNKDSPPQISALKPEKTTVAVVVGSPANPQFWLYNEGEITAEQPKYGFVIYDLDQGDIEQPRRILQIPFKRFDDYILPRKGLGPWRVLDLSPRAQEVPIGHRVFGYVTVQCFNCEEIRAFWVFIKNGHSGWFREIAGSEMETMNKVLAKVIYSKEKASEMVEEVIPKEGRVNLE